jgi:hypothetical protein
VTSPLISGSSLTLIGSRFQGISQASGGTFQDSSTNYPLVQLRNIDNSQVAFVSVHPIVGWSDTSFTSTPVNNFSPGPALVTVFTNGIPSDSKYLVVASATPTPPIITSASASPNTLWPPNHKMVPVTVSVSATDNSGAVPTCQIVSVSSSEPINGLGEGDTAPDWQITGPLTVNLRAERSGKGTGRTYTIIVACTDASGNTSTAAVTVHVGR